MAQLQYRANLSAKVFPFISEYFGRTVIVPAQDQNFSRQLTSSEDLDKDRGIPQLYYCHNVMPTAEGFQSIGYNTPVSDARTGFTMIKTLRDVDGNEVFFSAASDGKNYILPFGETLWTQINSIAGQENSTVTTASINGQTFIFFSNIGCYLYDYATNLLVLIEMLGLDVTKILGITTSAGYMIAWSDNSVAWSSTVSHDIPTDPIDFVPSLTTGAGGGSVESAKGKLTICVSHYLGFIIYTTDNAVGAIYSGNARYPFNFREIVGTGGLANESLISNDSGGGNHYAYTTSGLQLVSISQAQTIYPDVTDFIAGKYFEDFDEDTLTFQTQILVSPMKKAINIISDRYLVISYGVGELTHALVFDLIQKRYGKLRVKHTTCFEFKLLTPEVIETPRSSLGFLQDNGTVKLVDFSNTSAVSFGIMILGKYQYTRSRMLQLNSVSLENIRQNSNFKLYNMTTLDGKNTLPPREGYLAIDKGNYREFNFHQVGMNHTLIFKGKFSMVSLELTFNVNGRR